MSERRVVIRPALGDEVPEDTRARARELEAELDIPGLRSLLTGLARDGLGGHDIVALGQFAGSGWDFLGADIEVDGRSALRDPRWSERLNEHGLLSNRADADAVLEALGGGELVPVRRLRRSAIEPGDRIWYTIGNEHSPSDPFGRIVLTIEDDGAAELELYSRQGSGAWTGQVDRGVLARIRDELARSAFPEVPQEPIPAGSAMRQLEVVTGDEPQYAMLAERQGKQLDGYKQAFALLDSLAVQLSSGAYRGATDTLGEAAVTGVADRP
jgi:hypothetical protein